MLSFLRQDSGHFHELVVIVNLTPVPRLQYRVGLPRPGKWHELLNSDAAVYGGSNMGNQGSVTAAAKPWHNQPCSADFILPPLSILAFRPERVADKGVANSQAEPEKGSETLQGVDRSVSVASVSASLSPHPGPLSGGEATAKVGARRTDRAQAGVRPSSGAAGSNPHSALESSHTKLLADVAAPGDAAIHAHPGNDPISRLKGGDNTAQGNALGISPPHGAKP